MPLYQDTRTTVFTDKATVYEYRKNSSQSSYERVTYTGSYSGVGQVVTSVRSTCKPVPQVPTELESRRFLFGSDLESVLKDEATRPRKFGTKLSRKIWELTNPNPCDMKKSLVTGVSDKKFFILHVQQPNDPIWNWYDLAWEGDIMRRILYGHMPIAGPYKSFSPDSDRFRDLAITKAYANAKSPVLPIQVYLGELAETLHMLREPLGSLRKMLGKGSFKKGRKLKSRLEPFKDLLEGASGTWLEYRYGWMPLVYQVQEIMDAFNYKVNHGFPIQIVRGGSHLQLSETNTLIREAVAVNALSVSYVLSKRNSIRAAAVLATRQKMSSDKFFGNRWGDLVQTAWELKTLSFVWDWFFQIGDWLQAIVPDPDLTVLANSVSIKRVNSITVAPVAYGISYPTKQGRLWFANDNETLSDCTYKEESLVRVVNVKLPNVPILRKQWLSLARTADALSLTIGKILNLLR